MPVSSYGPLLSQEAAARGEDLIIEFGDERVSLSQLDRRANQSARGLMRLGAVPGGRVAIMLPDSPEFLYAFFGALRLGSCAVPVPATARGEVLASLLAAADAPVLVTHNDLHKVYRRVAKQAPATKRVAVSLRDASPVLKIFPGVDIMQDWYDLLAVEPPEVPAPKKGAPAVAFVGDDAGETPEICYGAGFKRLESAASLMFGRGDRLQPSGQFSDRRFLEVTLPAAIIAGAIISVPAPEQPLE